MESGQHMHLGMKSPSSTTELSVGLFLPLRMRNQTIGVLEIYGPDTIVEKEMVEILLSLTVKAATALENARLYGELAERERMLQDMIGKLLSVQEEERRRVAYEVHDSLAQVAAAAHQHLQAFSQRYPPTTKRSRSELERILKLVRQTVSDARKVIANLRPAALDDFGLAVAISLEVERLREEGYQVDYEEELGDEGLPDAVEIALFRIAQEALTNVRKHAQTRRVYVELRRQGDKIYLEVRDHGCGFDPDSASGGSGPGERTGLAGMRERARVLDGELQINSRLGTGTSIIVVVPLPATAED
jgi:signal transduction histidine kinase